MANPVDFEGANKIFRAPSNMENCGDLPVFQDESGIYSAWRMTPEDLEEINRTGVVWIRVSGGGLPPICLSGVALLHVEGRPAVAEPYIPKARIGGQISED